MAVLFSDGFESGNLSAWTGNVVGDMTVTAAAARTGSFGARGNNTSSTRVNYKDYAAAAAANHYFRFYLRVVGAPTANTGVFFVQTAGTGTNTLMNMLLTTGLTLRPQVSGSPLSDSPTLNLNTWYRVEVRTDSTGGSNNVIVEVRLNGVVFARLDNGNPTLNAMGRTVFGVNTGSTGIDLHFDDFQINDAAGGYPGGLNEPSSMNKDLLLLL